MKKLILLATIFIAILTSSCNQNSPAPATPATPATPISTNITFNQSIGSAGMGFSNFNFSMSGWDIEWTLATDGNFVYVGDFGNNCVKKIDLTTNSIVGWFGFQGNTWGYYTTYTSQPNPLFKPFRLVYKNNNIYAFSRKVTTGESIVYKFSSSSSSTVDTSRVIPEQSFFSTDIDNNGNVVIANSDSIKIYSSTSVTRFGGFGSADSKLDNSGYVVQVQSINDTIVVIDAGNSRFQKFTNTGNFISKFPITANKNYHNFYGVNNKYYFLSNGKFAEYTSSGNMINEYTFIGNPNNFGAGQKQFVVLNNKVVFQDGYSNKLLVYTK